MSTQCWWSSFGARLQASSLFYLTVKQSCKPCIFIQKYMLPKLSKIYLYKATDSQQTMPELAVCDLTTGSLIVVSCNFTQVVSHVSIALISSLKFHKTICWTKIHTTHPGPLVGVVVFGICKDESNILGKIMWC